MTSVLLRLSWKIEKFESTNKFRYFIICYGLTALRVDNVAVFRHSVEEPDVPKDDVLDKENEKSINIEDVNVHVERIFSLISEDCICD